MSGQVINDPEKLEEFANSLSTCVDNIDSVASELKGSFNEVSEYWDDAQRDSFEEVYNELLQCLSRFKEDASETVPYLKTKVAQAREYLES